MRRSVARFRSQRQINWAASWFLNRVARRNLEQRRIGCFQGYRRPVDGQPLCSCLVERDRAATNTAASLDEAELVGSAGGKRIAPAVTHALGPIDLLGALFLPIEQARGIGHAL